MIKRLIHYGCSFAIGNAVPHFVDIEQVNFGINIKKLSNYLKKIAIIKK